MTYQFGPFTLPKSQVFYESAKGLSYATVNLKPIVPGHVLVVSRSVVPRVGELSEAELCDMWVTARHISAMLEGVYTNTAFTFAIQDGSDAGQTVPHVHLHILPRRKGDFTKNDEIYEHLQMDANGDIPPRSAESMAEEAQTYREALNTNNEAPSSL